MKIKLVAIIDIGREKVEDVSGVGLMLKELGWVENVEITEMGEK